MRGFRILQCTIGIIILSFFISINPTASADSGQSFNVGTSNLNVRTTPSGNGEVIGQLGYGNKVVVFKEANGWAQTYYDGEEAWVASQYLYPDNESPVEIASTQKKITITANSVRIRSGSGTGYDIIGSTNSGESFQLLDTQDGWNKISLNNGSTGWISASLTDSSQESTNKVKTTNTVSEDNTKAPEQAVKQSSKSLNGYNIVLDPGHGGNDPGAIGLNGVTEKDLILSTANKVAQKLRDAGATVIMTRTNDSYLSLEERVSISNSYYTHAFISLHYDAFPIHTVNGFSTHFYSSFGHDRNLAQEIQSGIKQNVNLNSRGIMQGNYYVLRENRDLAVLVELGFITNQYDLSVIQTAEYQNGVANGITSGLLNYFHN